MIQAYLSGRLLLKSEIPPQLHQKLNNRAVKKYSGFIERNTQWLCRRCLSKVRPIKPKYCLCDGECGYCTECIQMGKIKRCSTLYSIPEQNQFKRHFKSPLAWQGQLSAQQAAASKAIIQSIKQKQTRLIWAVTGAGKTEMLFDGIAYACQQGLRIGVASPRVDVCLELFPRLKKAFPTVLMSLLYGEANEPYHYAQLTLCTTHQLFRFYEAFDVLIIDEIDAFPYDVELPLQRATQKACKKEAALIYLSATPNKAMKRQVQSKQLLATILPARYHGYPLPVPRAICDRRWHTSLLNVNNQSPIMKHMQQLTKQRKHFLVFIPNIDWCHQWQNVLKKQFAHCDFEAVHACSSDRSIKVQRMRDEQLDFLLTTTILERGVTFPNIDVIVIGADSAIFTESSLVQIAGRAGRSPKYPTGEVTYYYSKLTRAVKGAIKQVTSMNRLARERGLIHDG